MARVEKTDPIICVCGHLRWSRARQRDQTDPDDAVTHIRYFDEVMTFRPAHSLAAHRPLGGVMRARLQIYKALSDFRHRENGTSAANTADIEEIPA